MKNIFSHLLHLILFLAPVTLYGMELTTKINPIEQGYFRGVPENYKEIVSTHLDLYKQDSNPVKVTYKKMFHFLAIASQDKHTFNNKPLIFKETSGYCMLNRRDCNDFCTGKSNADNGFSCLSFKYNYELETDKPNFIKKVAEDYKFHLMPKGPAYEDFEELIQLIKKDEKLRERIVTFKVSTCNDSNEQIKQDADTGKEIFPKIVIYAAAGKHNAQIVCDRLFAAFKDKEGLDITPRYNKRINSYLYYSNGNGDDKKIAKYKDFFEQSDLVHFKSDITGEKKDYHLQIPTEKEVQIIREEQAGMPNPVWLFLSSIKNKCHTFMAAHYKKFIVLSLPIASFILYRYLNK
jgi:hypothetical protein